MGYMLRDQGYMPSVDLTRGVMIHLLQRVSAAAAVTGEVVC